MSISSVAADISRRSTCIRRRYGSVVVDADRQIISTGYNGAAKGEPNCCDLGVCERERLKVPRGERYELCRAIHAEQNALLNVDPVRARNGTIYIAGFNADGSSCGGRPCLICERMIRNTKLVGVCFINSSGRLEKWERNPEGGFDVNVQSDRAPDIQKENAEDGAETNSCE